MFHAHLRIEMKLRVSAEAAPAIPGLQLAGGDPRRRSRTRSLRPRPDSAQHRARRHPTGLELGQLLRLRGRLGRADSEREQGGGGQLGRVPGGLWGVGSPPQHERRDGRRTLQWGKRGRGTTGLGDLAGQHGDGPSRDCGGQHPPGFRGGEGHVGDRERPTDLGARRGQRAAPVRKVGDIAHERDDVRVSEVGAERVTGHDSDRPSGCARPSGPAQRGHDAAEDPGAANDERATGCGWCCHG